MYEMSRVSVQSLSIVVPTVYLTMKFEDLVMSFNCDGTYLK